MEAEEIKYDGFWYRKITRYFEDDDEKSKTELYQFRMLFLWFTYKLNQTNTFYN